MSPLRGQKLQQTEEESNHTLVIFNRGWGNAIFCFFLNKYHICTWVMTTNIICGSIGILGDKSCVRRG